MKNIMEYKGYLGSVEFSEEDEMFFGRVLGIRSLISYEGDNAKDLIADFHNSVDEYLKWCEDEGRKPEKAYKGSFNIRISPKLHKQLVICAMSHDMTLNGYIQEILEKADKSWQSKRAKFTVRYGLRVINCGAVWNRLVIRITF